MHDILLDLRFALRALRRAPGFAIAAVGTLTLGIGATTAIFSVVYGVLLRPLPLADPGRLVTVWENRERRDGPTQEWTGRSIFAAWREGTGSLSGMTAVTGWAPELSGVDRPEILNGALVSAEYFSVLGVRPARGRGFLPEEETPGNDAVVVLAHELWQRRFGGDVGIVGSTLTLNGRPTTVVGVLRPGFVGPIVNNAELWSPLPIDRGRQDVGNFFLRVIGRLAPGVDAEAATTDMNQVAAAISREHPLDYRDVGVTLEPLRASITGPVRQPLLVLLGAVALVLVIACVNVANLLLARATARHREVAVRAALGAGRRRLVRQLLTESVVLALAGGALGLLLAIWGVRILVSIAPAGMPRADEIGLHPGVLLFTLLTAIGTGLLFGLAPALGLSRQAGQALREGDRGSSRGAGGALRSGLVIVELGLGMAVLISAGLLLRSLAELRRVDPGFVAERTLSGLLVFPAARYPDGPRIVSSLSALEERVHAVPGVQSVGAITVLPLSGLVNDISFGIESRMPAPGEEPAADERRVTPGFFTASGVPVLRGRVFDDNDRRDGPRVTVISEAMARRHFADDDPLGQRLRIGGVRDPESPWWTIVGVVGSVRSRALDRLPEPEIYVPLAQRPARAVNLVVRSAGDPTALIAALRTTVASLDPDMPFAQLATLDDVTRASLAPQRFLGTLLGVFAVLALTLATVGVYGVMSFAVGQRVREIGVRVALGAGPGDVLGTVMRRGLALTAGGLALGFVGALAASRALAALLYGVPPTDPATFAGVIAVLAATAAFACYWPARRAARLDPVESLRVE